MLLSTQRGGHGLGRLEGGHLREQVARVALGGGQSAGGVPTVLIHDGHLRQDIVERHFDLVEGLEYVLKKERDG